MNAYRGHRALRRGRVSQHGRVYHVTFATLDRVRWFEQSSMAAAASRTFSASAAATHAQLLCWGLMPDHFHGLLQLQGQQPLARCVQRLKGRATVACHVNHDTPAGIWARGYYDRSIRRQQDIKTAARYIIANPLRAGLVTDLMCYPYWDAVWL